MQHFQLWYTEEHIAVKKNLKKVTVSGMEVDLCCPGCLKKYNKANDKFALIFSDKGYEKGFALKDAQKTTSKPK